MAMAHGNLCRHGWVPSQPLLVIVSPFYPLPPLPPPALPPHFPLSIALSSHSSSFGSPPPTPRHTHTHHPPTSLSLSKDLQATVPSLHTLNPPHNTHPHTTTSSAPPHPLFLSERMFQPLHTDSSGILCVEMFLLDPQALTIYRTKASAPLLKAWHLWPCAYTSDLSLWLIFLSSQLTDAPVFKRCLTDTTLTVVKVNAMQYMLWLANNKEINK